MTKELIYDGKTYINFLIDENGNVLNSKTKRILKKLSETTDYYNNRKLTKDDVKYIRKNKGTISSRELAKIFNVSKTTILNAQNYKLYN